MAKADKSALITKAVIVLRAREFINYSKAAAHYRVRSQFCVRICQGLTKTKEETALFYH